MDLWVVIPAYNEAAGIAGTLRALREQHDRRFTPLVVDNGSTDGTAQVARDCGVEVIHETRKGTGAASDTGIRHAISRGATHLARTDADCLPRPDWTANVRRAFDDGLELVGGKLRARTDEYELRLWERRLIPAIVETAAFFGKVRPSNRSPEYRGPYVMMPGATLAITADLYQRCGGFPRTSIEEMHEDRELVNRVRRLTGAYGSRRDVVVFASVRRLRAYGLAGTLAWYINHHNKPEVIDIR
ncbi:glycosyltransferase [Nonomuraea sp. NPDC046570]|uniref:glycosyltransferase n=1 Tax=Nonomuraea sp. NPDC046570 TaxID=3155255 RepID=UPI0033CC1A8B